MRVELNDEDSLILRDLLEEFLPGLRREIARTEKRELRHDLVLREELCERLLAQLAVEAP
jgi:hypothetical protein